MDQHFSLLRSSSFMHPPNPNDSETACSQTPTSVEDSVKAKIVSHPKYSVLLSAFLDCHKVGAPPEVEAKISGAANELAEARHQKLAASFELHADPELDQFMEAYCGVLVKYHDELMAPVQEAMDFLTTIHLQLSSMSDGAVDFLLSNDEKCEAIGSSEEDQDIVREAAEHTGIDLRDKEEELKLQLLRRYSGYLSNLRQELSKKKKNGKLPKEARQKLLHWWESHYKWPYPSETEKVALAESTGLDQKQINNWFINQRKRHWKPSEDMQFVVMDGYHPHQSSNAAAAAAAAAALYLDGQFMSGDTYRLGS